MKHGENSLLKHKTLIIAEGGVNHNKELDTAFKLADAAKESGADVFKLQLETPTDYCLCFHDTAKVYRHCESIGIPFACTAFDVISLKFLLDNCKMPFVKLASHNWGGNEVVRMAHESKLPLIISTRDESDLFRLHLGDFGWKDVTILHCVGEYPTRVERANLRRIKELQNKYKYPIGFSDHSGDEAMPALAVVMGAIVVECHITLDSSASGPDHMASLEPRSFKRMVENVAWAEKALG